MKKAYQLLIIILFLFVSISMFSQAPPPPPPSEHGGTGNKNPGGGAPIGSGLFILLGLGAIYLGGKIYHLNKEKLEE